MKRSISPFPAIRQRVTQVASLNSDMQTDSFERLNAEIVGCCNCERLVAWRQQVGREKRAAYTDSEYWARPLTGFGDPAATLLMVGLAPAAHGGNRTGRIFTGDRSGDWLFGALHRAGYANQPTSERRDDGLRLSGAYVSACVRCAPPQNRPTLGERDTCLPYLARELRLLPNVKVIVCLGKFAFDGVARLSGLRRGPVFGHGVEVVLPDGRALLCSYHPSQQNTFTRKLTLAMFDAIFARAQELETARLAQ
ncbi:MAG: uracil-DNA glycosylase [Chloroflexota bacterium]